MRYEKNPVLSDVSESKLNATMDRAQRAAMEAMALPWEILHPPKTEEIDTVMAIIMWHENASQWCRFVMITAEWDE